MPPTFEECLRDLDHPKTDRRAAAAHRLAKFRRPEAVAALCEALRDAEPGVRREAAQALGKAACGKGNREIAVNALITALGDRYAWVRRSAVAALGKLGGETVAAFVWKMLSDKKQSVQLAALNTLIEMGPSVVPLVCARLSSENSSDSEAASHILQQMLHSKGKPFLQSLLMDTRLPPQTRYQGLQALRGQQVSWFRAPYFTDTTRFCQLALASEEPRERLGAQEVLDYLSLGRASQRDRTAEGSELLRGAQADTLTDDGTTLLRGAARSDSAELQSAASPLLRWRQVWRRLLARLRHSSERKD